METQSKPSAMEAMNPKPRDPRIVYQECRQIMQRYVELLSDVYARSTFTMIATMDGESLAKVIYPPETEEIAAKIRKAMQEQVNLHLKSCGYEPWEP